MEAKSCMNYVSVITFILINCLASCSSNTETDAFKCMDGMNCNDVVLSRRKRSLTFPEGSSLQLVYDQTMPMPVAQLLFTVGVTCALAFELPTVPLHNITDTLRENLQMKLHPEWFTTEAPPAPAAADAESDDHSRIDANGNNLKYVDGKQNYYNLMNKHDYYYKKGGFKDKSDNLTALGGGKYDDLKKVVKTFINKYGQKVITMKIKNDNKKKKLGNIFLRKHHRVYPIFGKRSIDDHLTIDNLFYMDHHRNTRFDAYAKIETFLNGQKKDGTACVLRALCETAQKNQSEEKAPFLIEILRALFTLPHQVLPYKKNSHQMYDDAHSNLTADCAQLYPQFIIFCSTKCNSKKTDVLECTNKMNCDENLKLSRRKRQLTFPEASTLQLVYDQTMPIAAAQLLFTVGVTCALAFELPSVTIHNITETLREDLHKRLNPELYTTTTTAAPSNDSSESMEHNSRIDYNGNNFKYIDGKKDYYNLMNKHNYYYYGKYGNKNGFKDKIDNQISNDKNDTLKKVVKTFINKYGEKVITMAIKKDKNKKKKLGNVFVRKHNRVFPVFGKRSIDDHLTVDDLFYMDHHRNTRFDAYAKIETLLNGRKKDGTACVLRALCETAQKNQSEKKAPFLIEILRALFTLPHQVLPYKKDSHQMYDDAHSNLTADCAQLYPQCKDSFWSSDFLF
ncbi:hypothetical protein PVAND_002547 [Polypedilum vanderplanki]|uniref:Uncharacterized protein n=1 Tax=Polypedilum vanderplanki TaxID=319348 RepID=A0A9J6BRT8_POLVA|nr:hypothetical protein PVAND_002547 [Polypedilum vanderplanki]